QLCVPSQKTCKSSILQIATAGQGFDKRYFDVEINPSEYSYVDAAVAKGYSILTYDRLGTGASDKPDAYDVVQIPTDVEILAGLTKIARSGEIISSATVLNGSLVSDFIPTKIVHVGHAYGSYMGTFMLAKYGDLVDGALLTGLLLNNELKDKPITVLTYNHAFPREVNPILFADYGSGYFVLDSEETLQKLFFQKATLDPALLAYAESIKQPETVGQYATEDALEIPSTAANYTGPILFFTGEYDNYVCNGDCNGVQYQDQTEYIYGNATDQFSFYLQPNTGHATGLSMNASAGYEVMLQFLDSRGL
ncbi:Alpha/Beta hydrolase protein, partial [Lipomyces kononenkoae]